MGKALDNRVGCALMAELLQAVNNPEITLYGVGSVEEEVGLRGAQTSAEQIKPDMVIVLDTAVAGDDFNTGFVEKFHGGFRLGVFRP